MSVQISRPAGEIVRPYEASDAEVVRELLDGRSTREAESWFEWYRANPFLDHVPIAIVERSGGPNEEGRAIVAALPFAAVRVRAEDRTAIAMQPGDLATDRGVDEDEKATLRERAIQGAVEYYAAATVGQREPTDVDVVTAPDVAVEAAATFDTAPAFFFTGDAPAPADADDESGVPPEDDVTVVAPADGDASTASEHDDAGHDTVGPWDVREGSPTYHRIQDHGAVLAAKLPGPVGRALGAPWGAVARRIRSVRDGRVDFDTGPYQVMRHPGIPEATLAACYRENRPASAHLVHDEDFFDWWFDRPDRGKLVTYVVYRHSEVAAGLVVEREETAKGVDAATIRSVVPVAGDPDRPDAVAAGMERLLKEQADADEVRTANPLFPDGVRSAYGLKSGDGRPTKWFVTDDDRWLGIRPVVAGERTLGDHPFGETASFLQSLV